MLPIPYLDDEGFAQIVEQAKGMIPRFSPDWTDFNHHDPGITLIELFAFMKESQQYHLDQIGPRNRLKFLKLLGQSPAPAMGAELWCTLGGSDTPCTLPRGTRFLAGEIPFELTRPTPLATPSVVGGLVETEERTIPFQITQGEKSTKLHLEVFGREPVVGNSLSLRLEDVPPTNRPLRLFLRLEDEGDVARNPLTQRHPFTPLVALDWFHHTLEGWKPLAVLEDNTHGFLFSGEVVLAPSSDMAFTQNATMAGGCWIRAQLREGRYDVPPVLASILSNVAPAIQQETTAEMAILPLQWEDDRPYIQSDSALARLEKIELWEQEEDGLYHRRRGGTPTYDWDSALTTIPVLDGNGENILLCAYHSDFELLRKLGQGNGFPNQTFELPKKGLLPKSFALLIQGVESTGYALWTQVADFDTATPEDTHYMLDSAQGIVTFGDCEHGMAPEGKMFIVGLVETLGQRGNIKAGALENICRTHRGVLPKQLQLADLGVNNPDYAVGGSDAETIPQCLARCRRSLQQIERAVTYEDYETLVYGTPGLRISNCKAVPVNQLSRLDGTLPSHCVRMVVEPYGQGQIRTLSPAYRENILNYLHPRRMLGTAVEIVAPEYVRITVYAEIFSQPHYLDAKKRIAQAVAHFFQTDWAFGRAVRYSELYGQLDTLDCVSKIETITIDAQGKGISRSISGDVILPYNGLPVLQGGFYQVRPGE